MVVSVRLSKEKKPWTDGKWYVQGFHKLPIVHKKRSGNAIDWAFLSALVRETMASSPQTPRESLIILSRKSNTLHKLRHKGGIINPGQYG